MHNNTKNIKQILSLYLKDKPVRKAYLFGSVARGEHTEESDVDILIEFNYEKGVTYFLYYDMQKDLSALLKTKVDLISDSGLSPHIRPIIDKEKILMYEAIA